MILEKFEKGIEQEFDEMPASTAKASSVGKNRLTADAETYNNIY